MDYDSDGILDFISGSYDPGDLYLFRGEGNGNYAKVQKILDKSGLPVVHHPEEFAKYEKMKDDPLPTNTRALRRESLRLAVGWRRSIGKPTVIWTF